MSDEDLPDENENKNESEEHEEIDIDSLVDEVAGAQEEGLEDEWAAAMEESGAASSNMANCVPETPAP